MKGEGIGNKNKGGARAYSRKSRKAEDSNARGARDKAAIAEDSLTLTCPGCIKCGPPIMVKADEGCDGSGRI